MSKVLTSLLVFTLCLPGFAQAKHLDQSQSQNNSDSLKKSTKSNAPTTKQYIVVFRDDLPWSRVRPLALELTRDSRGKIDYVYQLVLKGFALESSQTAARRLSRNPHVKYVQEASQVKTLGVEYTPESDTTFWGLDRIDQQNLPLDNSYTYNRVGSGVHVYVIDSGIRLSHHDYGTRAVADFDFQRASSDPDFGVDTSNHGTLVTGVIGGKQFGVAKNVELHSVRVLDPATGAGSSATVIAGMDYVAQNHISPAVANISLTVTSTFSCGDSSVDAAAQRLIDSGVTVVAGAGDSGTTSACNSPQRVAGVITVGSTTSSDFRTPGTNFGPQLHLFAPGAGSGQFIPSTGFQSDDASDGFSFTSASAPHVSGVAAQYLEFNPAATPADVNNALTSNATFGVVSNAGFRSPNLLLFSGFIPPPDSNPIDDPRFFVRQHYYDFLRKQPDQGGWDFWTNGVITNGEVNTSRAFWESTEFRELQMQKLQEPTDPDSLLNPSGTPEYNNDEFVRYCYRIYLQRQPDQSGLDFWTAGLNSCTNANPGDGSQCYNNTIGAFLASTEFRARFE